MTELASPNGWQRLWQAIRSSRHELASANVRQLLRDHIPSRRQLSTVAPLKRGLWLGLVALTAFAIVAPILAIASLELAIASQSGSVSSGGRTQAGRDAHVETYDNILQRPLFSRSRQVLAVAVAPAVADAPVPPARTTLDPGLALRGVFMNGEQAKAFLTSADNPVGGWVGLNEQWSGWRLSEVKPNEIVLEADGQRQTLPLTVLK